MKNLTKIVPTALAAVILSNAAYADLDSDSATVSMSVAQFAALTGLDDFVLSTSDVDGSAGAVYSGSDDFALESNTQVRVSLTGGDLSNGSDSVSTSYDIDGGGLIMETAADSVHNNSHTVSAEATLGAISAQKAGAYSSEITLTVSAL
ncbi:MAG: hypothetical protein K6L73_14055 [Cellvibrionaceae bacterium]